MTLPPHAGPLTVGVFTALVAGKMLGITTLVCLASCLRTRFCSRSTWPLASSSLSESESFDHLSFQSSHWVAFALAAASESSAGVCALWRFSEIGCVGVRYAQKEDPVKSLLLHVL